MQRSTSALRYWAFQLCGWGAVALVHIFFAFLFNQLEEWVVYRLMVYIVLGIITSHLMRRVIRSNEVLLRPINQQIILLMLLTLSFSMLLALGQSAFERNYELVKKDGIPLDFYLLYVRNLMTAFIYVFIWNSIYFMYHYIVKSQRQQMETLQLEAMVKELELKTIKAHINPHFIFNALNGIRALIDENPQRARKAVTELSNILRSSLNAEKGETVALGDELKIVRDYLALEYMRFEDRLRIEYEIDENTLERQVPPMMLQTLVENAIKHGISKQVKGGVVKIISDVRQQYHELAVQNTGHLNGGASSGGFGLSSTQDRLSLLFGNKARFEIRQLKQDLVEAKVSIPLSLN